MELVRCNAGARCENCEHWKPKPKGAGYDGYCHRPYLAGRKEPARYDGVCSAFEPKCIPQEGESE